MLHEHNIIIHYVTGVLLVYMFRGSQAMKFFNSHQIKCNLERHPSASGIQSWKGGMVRIDPLATLQVLREQLLIFS